MIDIISNDWIRLSHDLKNYTLRSIRVFSTWPLSAYFFTSVLRKPNPIIVSLFIQKKNHTLEMTYTSNDVKFPFLFACFSANSGFKGMFSLAVVVRLFFVAVLVFLGSSSVISSLQNRA